MPPKLTNGSRLIDGNHLMLTQNEYKSLIKQYSKLTCIIKQSGLANFFIQN